MNIFSNKNRSTKQGFSFIEVMLTLSLFLILASVGVGSYYKYYSFSLNNRDYNQVHKILGEARFKAMKNPYNSDYGIHLNTATSEIVSFRDTYAPNNTENITMVLEQLNITDLNLQPNPGTTNNIIFENKTGKTQNTGSFTIESPEFQYTFNVNLQGVFE